LEGEPLAFASVYVQGTSRGTTTNVEGDYFLELTPGDYKLVFQYVGYKQLVKRVELTQKTIRVDAQLEAESVTLKEIVVQADAEDPAYAIIRKAISKRKYYKNLVDRYSCDVYVKGINKLLDAPEKILGNDLGNMGGMLDSNRQGIVYLSESEAKLFYQKPNEKKELMISSKIAGDDNGFSFNRASSMDFDFYENHIEIERNLISPIADNAMSYYRYKLIGTLFDEEGRLINKIEVLPKRSEDPVFRGFIYIVEDLWNIQSTELIVTGSAIKISFLDTLVITQIHVPIRKPDTWMMLSQSLDFKFGILGFKVAGNFTGVFSNYDLDVEFGKDFFNNELFKVERDANEKTVAYWDSIRPVPLTVEESADYIKKDSLEQIWESKAYRDSMDRKNNKFKVGNLLFGYQYNKSFKKLFFSIESPLTTIQFNPVQGWNGNLDITLRKIYDERNTRWFRINPKIQYGFSDEEWRFGLATAFNFNNENYTRISLNGGWDEVTQYNSENPITSFLNTYSSLFAKENYMRIYEKDYLTLGFRRELTNGVYFRTSLEFARRNSGLINTTEYAWFDRDDEYQANIPIHPDGNIDEGIEDEAIIFDAALRLRFDQKYITYPDQKFIMGSAYPDLWLRYRKGMREVDFDLITVEVSDQFDIGLVGNTEINIEGGAFVNSQALRFMDFQHFNGNQTTIFDPGRMQESFLLLPYYARSTNDWFVQGHFQHHFNGYIFDKIPLIRKLGLQSVLSTSYLYTPENKYYLELGFGFENLGIGILKIFRVDLVGSFFGGQYRETGLRLGISL
jgi:hypothetical protein